MIVASQVRGGHKEGVEIASLFPSKGDNLVFLHVLSCKDSKFSKGIGFSCAKSSANKVDLSVSFFRASLWSDSEEVELFCELEGEVPMSILAVNT
jgi:hypothetical protein